MILDQLNVILEKGMEGKRPDLRSTHKFPSPNFAVHRSFYDDTDLGRFNVKTASKKSHYFCMQKMLYEWDLLVLRQY